MSHLKCQLSFLYIFLISLVLPDYIWHLCRHPLCHSGYIVTNIHLNFRVWMLERIKKILLYFRLVNSHYVKYSRLWTRRVARSSCSSIWWRAGGCSWSSSFARYCGGRRAICPPRALRPTSPSCPPRPACTARCRPRCPTCTAQTWCPTRRYS